MATSIGDRSTVVVGYFSGGDEAHRAINALVDEGFLPTEIGAAFHIGSRSSGSNMGPSSGGATQQADAGTGMDEEVGAMHPIADSYGSGSTTGGAASGSSMVQYAALGGGSGTPFDGAGRPGPIPGSSLANTVLPTELKSELPHDAPLPHGEYATSAPATAMDTSMPGQPATSFQETAVPTHAGIHAGITESWGDKLKHIFGMGTQDAQETAKGPATAESQAFGTGEGHIVLNEAPSGLRYSQSAFESSFSSSGVQPEHARHLSRRIGHGGAIVTVQAAGRAADAERVLEAHGGQVRFSGTGEDSPISEGQGQVEVFGTVHRAYSSYNR